MLSPYCAHRLCGFDKYRRFVDLVELHATGFSSSPAPRRYRPPQLALFELRFARQSQDFLLFVCAELVPFHF